VQSRIVVLNPFRCRVWELHDRLEGYLTEEACRAEIESFAHHGQLIPVVGRALYNDPDYDVEIVCGARRLFVARHLNMELRVDIRQMSDREALLAMDIENRQRVDISPYERGMSYARWIRAGYFKSQDDIARALKISASQVSRLLKLARLPSVMVDAFSSPTEICEGWGIDLIAALEHPQRRARTLRRARALASGPRPPGREVYQQLMSAAIKGERTKTVHHDEVIKDPQGQPLFRIRRQHNSIAIFVPLEKVSGRTLESIRQSLASLLQPANGPADGQAKMGNDILQLTQLCPQLAG